MSTADDVFEKLRTHLSVMFEIPEENIVRSARLYEDLGLDSIDAIDLMVKLQEITQRKLKPEEFKTVRTVGDVLDRINAILAE